MPLKYLRMIDCYTKGIAFFLSIMTALLKFAVDSKLYRKTTPISAAPLLMLSIVTACFWLIVLGGWIDILCWMPEKIEG